MNCISRVALGRRSLRTAVLLLVGLVVVLGLLEAATTGAAPGDPATLTITKQTDPAGGTGFPFTLVSNGPVLAWGSSGGVGEEFETPRGVAVDLAGNVYVVEAGNNRVQKFNKDGTFVMAWGWDVVSGNGAANFELCTMAEACKAGIGGSGNGQFNNPSGIAVDDNGNVFVADTANRRIQKFTDSGTYLLTWGGSGGGNGQFRSPFGVATDALGNVYVADTDNSRVQKFSGNGVYITQWGGLGSGNGQFRYPRGIAVDSLDNVYVADSSNHRIQKFDNAGTFVTQWGAQGTDDGRFQLPHGIAVVNSDIVFISDTGNNRIQKFDSGGRFLGKWGSSGTGNGQFRTPTGIAVHDSDGIYVGDTDNHRIQKFVDEDFALDDDGWITYSFDPGNFNLLEVPLGGWSLTDIACDGGSPAVSGNSVNLTLQPADDITCTFINTADPGSITIVKEVVGQVPGSDWDYTGDLGAFTLPAAGGQAAFDPLAAGDYTVNETAMAGYSQAVVCDSGETGTGSITVSLQPGEDVICTFTNTADPGTITIIKEVVGQVPGSDWDYTGDLGVFTLPAAGGTKTFDNVAAGSYTVMETAKPGYAQSVSCLKEGPSLKSAIDPGTAMIDLQPGEDVTCTFTNTAEPGSITIVKDVVGQIPGSDWDYTGDLGAFGLAAAGGQTAFDPLAAGDYTVNETAKAGYSQSVVCDSGETGTGSMTVSLQPGEDVICTFTNTAEPGSILIEKVVAGQIPAADWQFSGGLGDFTLPAAGGQRASGPIDPGSYTITEQAVAGYVQSVACDNGFRGTDNVTIDLKPGVSVGCTFTNTAEPALLTITKETLPGGGADFPFTVVGFLNAWGSQGSGNGEFQQPHDVAVDSDGNVYVADEVNHRIQKFTYYGQFLIQWGGLGSGDGSFNRPQAVEVDSAGNVYVADTNNHRIQKFDSDGTYLMGFGTNGSGDGQFSFPMGIAVDSVGNIFVADSYNHRIQKFDSNGGFLAKWGAVGSGNGEFIYPTGIGFDSANNVYVAERRNHRVQKFDTDGGYVAQWSVDGNDVGQVGAPWGLAVDGQDNVYVADHTSHLIQKFASDGKLLLRWGSEGNGDGQFFSPRGVAVDSLGQVFVADTGNHRIQKFATGQTLLDDNEDASFAVAAGVYTIAEQVPDGWVQTSIACESGDPQVSTDAVTVTAGPGASISCTFTNTADPGSITIIKEVVGQAPTDAWDYTGDLGMFTLQAEGGQKTFDQLAFGDYTVNETAKTGYAQVVNCDSGESGTGSVTVSLQPGEDVTCTFTNTAEPGSITIVKEVVGQVPGSDWDYTGDLDVFTLPAAGGQTTFDPLAAGDYTVNEIAKTGYSQEVACDSGESGTGSVTVSLQPGEDVICTFTNTADPGSITVTKEIVGDGTGTFTICVDDDCQTFDGDGAQQTWSVAAGQYTLSEQDAGPEWIEPADQLVTVNPGQAVTIVVTNVYDPPITSFCPADDSDVGLYLTDLLGMGQPGRTRKIVVPYYSDLASIYGQLAALDIGTMRFVRFLPFRQSKIEIHEPTSLAYQGAAVSWWGSPIEPAKYVKGQFFWGAKANKSPRAFVLWPTYNKTESYANVLTLFDESRENHVAWEPGWIQQQTQMIPIPLTQANGAEISVQIALVDVNTDGRPVILTVGAGGVSETRVITGPNRKEALNLEEFLLTSVPAGTESVTITLLSPSISSEYPFGGDSAAMIGAAVSYPCAIPQP